MILTQAIQPRPEDAPAEDIPPGAPPAPDHYLFGPALSERRYGHRFVLATYAGNRVEELTWRENRWQFKPHPLPRPIYHRELLIRRQSAPVLIVDDETIADLGQKLLPAYVVVTWAHGPAAVMDADWQAVRGRDVIVWPNAGQFHVKLISFLQLLASRLRIVDARSQAFGWNLTDAHAQGMSASEIVQWATKQLTTPDKFKPPVQAGAVHRAPALLSALFWEQVAKRADWRKGFDEERPGVPYCNLANCAKLARLSPDPLRFDDFTQRVIHSVAGVSEPWSGADTADMTTLVQEHLQLPHFTEAMIRRGVEQAARATRVHSLQEFLARLPPWDGEPRMMHWLTDCFGVPKTDYSIAVGTNFLTALIARALDPGLAAPFMLVFEGGARAAIAQSLSLFAAPWSASVPVGFDQAQLARAARGKWLLEMPPPESYSDRQAGALDQALIATHDELGDERVARTAMLWAWSAGETQYDANVHYFGVKCVAMDQCALGLTRKQVLAEALARYASGALFVQVPRRYPQVEALIDHDLDSWAQVALPWCMEQWKEATRRHAKIPLTSARILEEALGIPVAYQEHEHKLRLAKLMKHHGWVQNRHPMRHWRPVFRRPKKGAPLALHANAAPNLDAINAPSKP